MITSPPFAHTAHQLLSFFVPAFTVAFSIVTIPFVTSKASVSERNVPFFTVNFGDGASPSPSTVITFSMRLTSESFIIICAY